VETLGRLPGQRKLAPGVKQTSESVASITYPFIVELEIK